MNLNRTPIFAAVTFGIASLAVCYFLLGRGYGEVSPATYELAKSLYSACLKKSDEHLNRVDDLLNQNDTPPIPSNERRWLNQIIKQAQNGDWESAAQKAKRMMEDQVDY
ncbi:MAG: hypothetical protein AAFN77_03140 [Planctomycetota bacterium]